jgi:hypothetical protein
MWQFIITGIIIAAAAGIALYRTIMFFRSPASHCDGCGMNCTGCSLVEMKRAPRHQGTR